MLSAATSLSKTTIVFTILTTWYLEQVYRSIHDSKAPHKPRFLGHRPITTNLFSGICLVSARLFLADQYGLHSSTNSTGKSFLCSLSCPSKYASIDQFVYVAKPLCLGHSLLFVPFTLKSSCGLSIYLFLADLHLRTKTSSKQQQTTTSPAKVEATIHVHFHSNLHENI